MANSVDAGTEAMDVDADEGDEMVDVEVWLLLLLLKWPYLSSSGPTGSVFMLGQITMPAAFPDLFGATGATSDSWPNTSIVSFLTWASSASEISCLTSMTWVVIDGADCIEVEMVEPSEERDDVIDGTCMDVWFKGTLVKVAEAAGWWMWFGRWLLHNSSNSFIFSLLAIIFNCSKISWSKSKMPLYMYSANAFNASVLIARGKFTCKNSWECVSVLNTESNFGHTA